jgi:hypothetical protein
MPPVLNVALNKLVRRRPEYMPPDKLRRVADKSRAVLNLVAEAVSSA